MDSKRLMNKRTLVIGGHGYLGSHLIPVLQSQGADVYLMSRKISVNEKEYCADITDFESVQAIVHEIQPEIIFHLAANISRNRDFSIFDQMMQVNAFGTLNILRALDNKRSVQLIFTSSSEIYGNNESPFHENQLPKPVSPYSLSKYTAEQIIQTYATLHAIPFTILRVFNFFGRNMSEDFFIPQMVNSLLRGEDFLMTKGEQTRDFLFVDDVVDALILAAVRKEAHNEIFNVCSGVGTQLAELASKINYNLDTKARIITGALPYRENEVWEMIGSNNKIKQMLGFEPKITITEGIQRLII
ncbi:MAG: NAD-dependent epimerase/dehydratase family protein [Saprospiraceae bacterium]